MRLPLTIELRAFAETLADASMHVYEVRPRKDHRGVDLSDRLFFGRLWYDGRNAVANALGYAEHDSRSHDAVNSSVDDAAGNVIEAHEH